MNLVQIDTNNGSLGKICSILLLLLSSKREPLFVSIFKKRAIICANLKKRAIICDNKKREPIFMPILNREKTNISRYAYIISEQLLML